MRRDVASLPSSASEIARPPETARAHAWLARPSLIFTAIGLYLLGHLALRLLLSPTLGIDDAEQILFAQHWAFGYRFRQPPLFTWMLLPIIDLIGPGALAISLVRYGLLAVTYVFLYLTACLCLHDRRMAGLAVFSYTTIYVFAYYAHHDLTHTTALGALIALTLYITARLALTPSFAAYLALGLVFGLGVLAKWNFVMLAIGLPLTCLLLPSFRHLVLTWKTLAALAVMIVVLAPTSHWMLTHGQTVEGLSQDILSPDNAALTVPLLLEGGSALAGSILLFPLPFLPLFLLLFGQSLLKGMRTAPPPPSPPLSPSFFGWSMLIVLGLHTLLIPIFGAVNFTERWLHPALMSLPIFLFALAERGRPKARQISAFLGILAILVAVVAGARLYRYASGADDCTGCREFVPFAAFAQDLRAAGFSSGIIVADGMHIGGNLNVDFADSRVIDPAFPRALWAEAGEEPQSCLLVWQADGADPEARATSMRDYAIRELGLPAGASGETGRLDRPLIGSRTRQYSLGFALYPETAGGCR